MSDLATEAVELLKGAGKVLYCGLSAERQDQDRVCKWPDGKIGWAARDAFPGLTLADTEAALDWAFSTWAAAGGIEPFRSGAPRVLFTVARIDGPGAVLGDAQLPCGSLKQSVIRGDASDRWAAGLQPKRGFILAALFLLHEVGHALGIFHHARQGAGVMSPAYDETWLRHPGVLSPADVEQVRLRYGPPRAEPPPGQPPAGRVLLDLARRIAYLPDGWTSERGP